MKKINIFDTTLRDGQQCPGAGMSHSQNVEYAQLAAQLGVDILEAGFPAASAEDFQIVHNIASMYAQLENGPKVAALCQMRPEQMETTIHALEPLIASQRAVFHVYLPVAPELMNASLGSYAQNKSQVIRDAQAIVAAVVDTGLAVEFSPEAYSQMGENFDFTTDLLLAVIEAGASVINCPDTIGRACYLQGEDYFVNHMNRHAEIMKKHHPKRDITWSVHCHNDFGLALDNSMRAVFDGPATQVEGCFNGIGERAGNVALEQCIMYLKTFGKARFFTETNARKIRQISDFINRHMLPRQPHWPISGDNAAKHSSGGHTNAILKNAEVYQPFEPNEVGQSISFVFGPLSGSNHAQSIIQKHGYRCDHDERQAITQYIKDFHKTRRKGLTDEEFMSAYFAYRKPIRLLNIKPESGDSFKLRAEIFGHEEQISVSAGTATTALCEVLSHRFTPFQIESYRSESKKPGQDANAHASISISSAGEFFQGKAHDQDIETAALKALINAYNQLLIEQHYAVDRTTRSLAPIAMRD